MNAPTKMINGVLYRYFTQEKIETNPNRERARRVYTKFIAANAAQ